MRQPIAHRLLSIVMMIATTPMAAAQTSPQLAELNSLWASIAQEDRADLVLLPALRAITPPPEGIDSIAAAAAITPESTHWAEAAAWVSGESQTKLLEALRTITERRSRFGFAQPYGQAAGSDAAGSGLFVELGDPELIARARFGWFKPLDTLAMIVQIEATRLVEAGDGDGAMDLMTRWVRFARMMLDREYFIEKKKAFEWMRFGAERLRDLVYLAPDSLDESELRAAIRELADREFNLDRIRLPRADKLAAQELLEKTFLERGGPDPKTFGATFAQLESGEKPLRLFTEAARWRRLAEQHADRFDTRDKIDGVFNDWSLRWNLGTFDPILQQATDFSKLDRGRFSLIASAVPDIGELFGERLALRTELAGTRLALAIVGYRRWSGDWPDPIFAVRPRFVPEIPLDPMDPTEAQPLRFFVPMRDVLTTERTEPQPHGIAIKGDSGGAATAASIPDEEAVYSWIARTASIIPPGTSLTPQAVTQMANAIPDTLPNELRSQLRSATLDRFRQGRSEPFPTPLPDWMMRLAGAAPDDPRTPEEIATDAMLPILFSAPYRLNLLALAQKPSVSIEDVRRAIAKAVVSGMRGPGSIGAGSASGRLYAIPSFSVTLDRTSFILYSVGEDGKADRAVEVGPGGTDLLLWPPMFSLIREHLR